MLNGIPVVGVHSSPTTYRSPIPKIKSFNHEAHEGHEEKQSAKSAFFMGFMSFMVEIKQCWAG